MFGNNKKTIGVFIAHVNGEYQSNLSKGIITKAQDLDYNVAFFTNFGFNEENAYEIGESYITDLPHYDDLDGIIISTDVMMNLSLIEKYKNKIKEKSHCPVVCVREELPEYYNVLIDDYTVLDEIIRHFIEIHKFTKINFLAGPRNMPTSEKRIAAYKKILSEHNIPIEEERIFYADIWRNAAEMAVDKWFEKGKESPEAIVCLNDQIALKVCRTLAEKRIMIPDQVAVSGCGDIEDAAEYSPSLTTARMPTFEMGQEAVSKIHNHIIGVVQPQNSYMETVTIYRSSCGCKRNWYHESNERRRNHIHIREALQANISRNAYMSAELTGLTRLEDVSEKILSYVYEEKNVLHFCLCLRKGWDYYHTGREECYLPEEDEIIMEVGLKNKERYAKIKCSKKELIPSVFAENKAMVFFFALLHHQSHFFGYVGISFNTIQNYMLSFQAWLINVSNALENIRIQSELNRLVFKLEDMSIRDELTELYNRRVIETLGRRYLNQCIEEHSMLMIFTADMDKLKYINDKFGHANGDIAIKVVANALTAAADDDEICIRLGGDEFMAIGVDYDEVKMTKFINQFIEEINRFNFMSEYDFSVYVSYGYKLILPDPSTTIESCLKAADTLMYKQKADKNAKQIYENLICQ